jgi:hypothetical protein
LTFQRLPTWPANDFTEGSTVFNISHSRYRFNHPFALKRPFSLRVASALCIPSRPRIRRITPRLRDRQQPQFDIVHARTRLGDGGRVVVQVATSQSDRPHAVYALFGATDQEGGYEGKVENDEEDDILGHASVHHEGGFCSHQRR